MDSFQREREISLLGSMSHQWGVVVRSLPLVPLFFFFRERNLPSCATIRVAAGFLLVPPRGHNRLKSRDMENEQEIKRVVHQVTKPSVGRVKPTILTIKLIRFGSVQYFQIDLVLHTQIQINLRTITTSLFFYKIIKLIIQMVGHSIQILHKLFCLQIYNHSIQILHKLFYLIYINSI